jgi:hypothetical protein
MHCIATAARRRLEAEHNGRVWLAYHIAVLSRQKRIPSLQSLMIPTRREPQTWQEQMAICKAIAAAYGGAT